MAITDSAAFKVGETARCECGADKQDAQHILQDCILYSDQRSAIWPTEVSLKKKALRLMLRPAADHRVHQDYISDHLELTGERKEEEEYNKQDGVYCLNRRGQNHHFLGSGLDITD